MPITDSEAYFKEYLKKYGLYSDTRWRNMKGKGWNDITNYAYAWGHIEPGQSPSQRVFEDVISKIEGFTWGDDTTYPRIWQSSPQGPQGWGPVQIPEEPPWHLYRKTMFECRYATSIEMNRKWKSGDEVVRKITDVERRDKRDGLMQKYGKTSGCMMVALTTTLRTAATFFTSNQSPRYSA